MTVSRLSYSNDIEAEINRLSQDLINNPNDSNKVQTLLQLSEISESISLEEADS